MIDIGKIDDIVRRLSESLPPAAGRIREDLETQFRNVLRGAFEKMDLVSREEFDVQTAVLERTQRKLEALEKQLEELEKNR
jgi:BMFP domain-containing protein YqiC